MAVDMLQTSQPTPIQLCHNKWCLPPSYLTSLSIDTVLLLREVKPKSFDDLEIVEVAD